MAVSKQNTGIRVGDKSILVRLPLRAHPESIVSVGNYLGLSRRDQIFIESYFAVPASFQEITTTKNFTFRIPTSPCEFLITEDYNESYSPVITYSQAGTHDFTVNFKLSRDTISYTPLNQTVRVNSMEVGNYFRFLYPNYFVFTMMLPFPMLEQPVRFALVGKIFVTLPPFYFSPVWTVYNQKQTIYPNGVKGVGHFSKTNIVSLRQLVCTQKLSGANCKDYCQKYPPKSP